MARIRQGFVNVEVDVDVTEVLSEIENDALIDEVKSRGLIFDIIAPSVARLRALLHEQTGHAGPLFLCRSEVCQALSSLTPTKRCWHDR